MAEMDPQVAKRLHNEGATLIVSDVPEGTEFGIDYFSCNIGPRFRGIKMIPPGLHFIYYSAANRGGQSAPRTGLFLFSRRQDVFVMRWDPSTEDVVEVDVNEEEKDKYRQGLQEMDTFLGPYPYEHFKKWVSLTNHITEDFLERVQPVCKKISSVTELAQESLHTRSRTSESVDTINSSLAQNQETLIRFSEIPKQRYPDGASPVEMSKYSMDSSYALGGLINHMKDRKEILAELQFAFVCFLVGQVYDAFEHWKKLLNLLCSCDEALSTYSDIFDALIGGKVLSNDTQIRVIGSMKPETCTKLLRNLSEKLRAKFPATTHGFSMAIIARFGDALSESFEREAGPVEGQSLQQKDKKRRKSKGLSAHAPAKKS